MARFKFLTAQTIATLTSPQAIALYRRAGRYAVLCLQGAVALLLVLGVACFVLGWCCRQGAREARQWSDGFVAACERQEEPQRAIAPVAAPVALLTAPRATVETKGIGYACARDRAGGGRGTGGGEAAGETEGEQGEEIGVMRDRPGHVVKLPISTHNHGKMIDG